MDKRNFFAVLSNFLVTNGWQIIIIQVKSPEAWLTNVMLPLKNGQKKFFAVLSNFLFTNGWQIIIQVKSPEAWLTNVIIMRDIKQLFKGTLNSLKLMTVFCQLVTPFTRYIFLEFSISPKIDLFYIYLGWGLWSREPPKVKSQNLRDPKKANSLKTFFSISRLNVNGFKFSIGKLGIAG